MLISSPIQAAGAGFALQTYELPRPDGSKIQYHVDRKGGGDNQPILLILQGSDCNSVARHPSLSDYAEAAPTHAVLLVEKYGITRELAPSPDDNRSDCPVEYQIKDTMEQRLSDSLQVIAKLREATWWNRELVILAGSSGAGVGEQVAARVPETKQLIIFGFGSRFLDADIVNSIRSAMSSAGADPAAVDAEIATFSKQIRRMRDNPSPHEFMGGHSFAAWASMLAFDQLAALREVTIPVLAIHGLRDQNASPAGAGELISKLGEDGKTNIHFRGYEDLDHGFIDSTGASHKTQVIEEMRRWLVDSVE